jgi:hypothetical protein
VFHLQAACDAAHAEIARQKWLELEVARQTTRADAAVKQITTLEKERQQLQSKLAQAEVCGCG